MTRNQLFITIFLGLFSQLPAICGENTQYPQTTKIAIKGGIGACLGGLSYCASKTHYSGRHFQKEDLPLFGLSCGAGFCIGVVVGLLDFSQDRHRIYANNNLNESIPPQYDLRNEYKPNNPSRSEPIKNLTVIE